MLLISISCNLDQLDVNYKSKLVLVSILLLDIRQNIKFMTPFLRILLITFLHRQLFFPNYYDLTEEKLDVFSK
jgi:hypothetical protein